MPSLQQAQINTPPVFTAPTNGCTVPRGATFHWLAVGDLVPFTKMRIGDKGEEEEEEEAARLLEPVGLVYLYIL